MASPLRVCRLRSTLFEENGLGLTGRVPRWIGGEVGCSITGGKQHYRRAHLDVCRDTSFQETVVTVVFLATEGATLEGNYIGTDATGVAAIGNSHGVVISNVSTGNRIGGTVTGAGNIISGNLSDGASLSHQETTWYREIASGQMERGRVPSLMAATGFRFSKLIILSAAQRRQPPGISFPETWAAGF